MAVVHSSVPYPLYSTKFKCYKTCRHRGQDHEIVKCAVMRNMWIFRCKKCVCHMHFEMVKADNPRRDKDDE